MLFWIHALLTLCSAQEKTIVGLGDSWVEFDTYYRTNLGTYCKGKNMLNLGISATTAAQWAGQSCSRGNCNAQSILSSIALNPAIEITDVWLSVGGNDLFQQGILELQRIPGYIERIGAQIRSVVPDVKIFILGYSISGLPLGLDGIIPNDGAAMSLYDNLNEKLQSGATRIDATYVETLENVLQGEGIFGSPLFFADAIHMNQAGYCNIWTQDAFQKYLECEPETYIPCLPPAARSIECICYEGNNCENDCTNGGVCTLLEDSRAPVCLLPSDQTTREVETEETTSESVLTTSLLETSSTSTGVPGGSDSPTFLPSHSPITGTDLTTTLPEVSPSSTLTTSLSEPTSTSLPETTSAITDSTTFPSPFPSIVEIPITTSGISSTSVEATSIDSSTDSIITRTTSPEISLELSKKEGDNSEAWWMVVIILLSLLSIVSLLIAFYNWRRAKRLQDVYVLPVNAPKLSPPVIFSNMDKYSSLEDDSMDIRKTTSVSVSIYEIEEGTLPRSIMDVASRKHAPPLPPRKPGNNLSA